MSSDRGRLTAVMEASLVTFLWSTSYVLIKIGLSHLPPLIFAAYRYTLASLILIALAIFSDQKKLLNRGNLLNLLALGILGYSVAQGFQYVGLFYLPTVTVTFILNFTPVMTLILGVAFIREYPTKLQLAGVIMTLLGACLFFLAPITANALTGIAVTLLSGLGWSAYMVLSRRYLKANSANTFGLTAFSMGFGTLTLLTAALLKEGLYIASMNEWLIILWLSLINTALAFFLWNHALTRLKAFELSILQNTMLIQIAVLALLFLGEQLTYMKAVSIGMVFIGALIVTLAPLRR